MADFITPRIQRPLFNLDDKYSSVDRQVQLTGMQALLRMLLERQRNAQYQGLNTATLISGYPGSPLGGLESLLRKEKTLLDDYQIVFQPGLNEELALTSIMGSQIASTFPQPKYDGVYGVWYGKTPGLDRALDALKHANYVGTAHNSGALAIVGDDQGCKSSTVPNTSEHAFKSAYVPIFYPGNLGEVIELGLAAFALSTYAGIWAGFKLTTEVAESSGLVSVDERYNFVYPPRAPSKISDKSRIRRCFPPDSVEQEKDIATSKLIAATEFIEANGINKLTYSSPGDQVGFVAAGKTYYDLIHAFKKMGIETDTDFAKNKLRVLKLGVIWPIGSGLIESFAVGLIEIVVVEEKSAFIEDQIKSILFNQHTHPRVYGKVGKQEVSLFPPYGDLSADFIADRLSALLGFVPAPTLLNIPSPLPRNLPTLIREAWFCGGCPHNRSTKIPEESLVGGGIGCHTLSMFMDRNVNYISQMGGEGAVWIGASPFVETTHIFQNVGDGTFFHSASLALRAAIAANVNITYKILYNGVIAMTGGQEIQGGLRLDQLSRLLIAEGASKIEIVTENLRTLQAMGLPKGIGLHSQEQLAAVQSSLRSVQGVSVLIFDQQCALEKRRARKRGSVVKKLQTVYVSKEICEACGDCGKKSNCIAVGWKDTWLGQKVDIQQGDCSQDYSCVEGECPSFFYVREISKDHKKTKVLGPCVEPLRSACLESEYNILLAGIGGTGVVTISSILAHACWIEGKHNVCLDQTGMAQKGGAVVSHIVISNSPIERTGHIGKEECNLLIAFDALTITTRNLLSAVNLDQTNIIVNIGQTTVAQQIGNPGELWPTQIEWEQILCQTNNSKYLDINLNEIAIEYKLVPATRNLFMLGVAYQRGLIPLNSESIEHAIQLNNVLVEKNIESYRLGRSWVLERERVRENEPLLVKMHSERYLSEVTQAIQCMGYTAEINAKLEAYSHRLYQYHNRKYALDFLKKFQETVPILFAKNYPKISISIAHLMFKFRYIKDEYEVARLALMVRKELEAGHMQDSKFTIDSVVSIPFLRPIVGNKKIRIPERVYSPAFRIIEKFRIFRFTWLGLMLRGQAKKKEQALVSWFDGVALEITGFVDNITAEEAQILLAKIDDIRGYGSVKSRNIQKIVPDIDQSLKSFLARENYAHSREPLNRAGVTDIN